MDKEEGVERTCIPDTEEDAEGREEVDMELDANNRLPMCEKKRSFH